MDIPEDFHGFWRALDQLVERVEPAWWGAVVTDARFPAIWDTNYARIDIPAADLNAADIEQLLLPALRASGATTMHVVSFHPQENIGLLSELSTMGHKIGWDLVMRTAGAPEGSDRSGPIDVVEIAWGPELREAVVGSLALFDVNDATAVSQLLRQEEEVLIPAGTRWFGVRDDSARIVSLAALLVLEGVGYLDNVATQPPAQRRGYAQALAVRCTQEALSAGAASVYLLVDPADTSVISIYERAGFRGCGKLGSTKGPVPEVDGQSRGGGS